MVENLQCEKCSKFKVCGWFKKLKPFTEYATTPIAIDLTLDGCSEFSHQPDSLLPSLNNDEDTYSGEEE